jgi:hypothetical protein
MICCNMPCKCSNYTPNNSNRCVRCGCNPPCRCTSYSTEPTESNYDRYENNYDRYENTNL